MTDQPGVPILRDFADGFESERLAIRAPRPGDGAALHAAVTESLTDLRPWMPWAHGDYTHETAEVYVRQRAADFVARRDLTFLLFLRESGELVGASGLHPVDWTLPRFEIGYWVRSSLAGRGYATEAARRIAEFGFDTMNAQRIEIWCDERNGRSAAVALRAGFTLEARMGRNRRDTSGTPCDSLCFVRFPPAGSA